METTERKREYEICGMLRRGQTWQSPELACSRFACLAFLGYATNFGYTDLGAMTNSTGRLTEITYHAAWRLSSVMRPTNGKP